MMDKESHVCLMLIDLSAAFDTVNHDYVIQSLHSEYLVGTVGMLLTGSNHIFQSVLSKSV